MAKRNDDKQELAFLISGCIARLLLMVMSAVVGAVLGLIAAWIVNTL